MGNFRQIIGLPFGNAAMHLTRRDSRKTRNPTDPAQAYLIARADAKRARRAEKLTRDTRRASRWNSAHANERLSLFPFYIAQ